MPGGRPTDYTPDLGERIIAIMERGLSLTAAAADCDVCRKTVYNWRDAHPEFAAAVALGQAKRQSFLEKRLLSAGEGPVVTSSIFALKNAAPDDWREKVETQHSGEVQVSAVQRTIVDPKAA